MVESYFAFGMSNLNRFAKDNAEKIICLASVIKSLLSCNINVIMQVIKSKSLELILC